MTEENVSSKTLEEIDKEREDEDIKKLEAVLFVAGRFLNMRELIALSDLNPIIIREFLGKLTSKYKKTDSAIQIVHKGEGNFSMWKMDIKPEYAYLINRVATGSSEFSKAEQGTLAAIAFKQPIKQSVIVKMRGNKAYDHIKKFSELGMIKKKKLGHTYELSLSDDFYDYFNISETEIDKNPLNNSELKEIRYEDVD